MRFTFRCVDPVADAPLLHSWVTQPYASFWGMLSATEAGVIDEYAKIQASGHHHALLGLDGGVPAFLMEEYLPASSPLAAAYPVLPGDAGMHLLVAPPSGVPEPGFTTAVMDAVLARLFAGPDVERIVVEPDARNTKIHALNERFGFRPSGVVGLPDKDALLSFCTRADYLAARATLPTLETSARMETNRTEDLQGAAAL
ncbi:GNAT family N-acetyltransferase [Pseudarthrobacter sp. SL88]|uniref:GNAT family N-acetyltransferase n=1 Tax=Micrococcaceae TaxID=1268 RepID=UPI0006FD0573|nr:MULTISPECIES: GNAT family N-acetyltransferase [Micrococcaceae]KQQ82231.1 acetyltransferase [Arthrobacter sp. Leaf137]MCY1676187.1 GNAT family N-acetyltransferase [Pseudarthrobacter sp. SL88]